MKGEEYKPKYLASFARRVARTPSETQKKLLKEHLPLIQIDLDVNFALLRKGYAAVELEVGSGNGEFVIQLAQANPNKLYIACEPFINGVASLLKLIHENKVTNIRVFMDDARLLLSKFPDLYLEQIYVICPDPWPKRKQQKRRLINEEFLKLLHQKTKQGLLVVTDHKDYASWILNQLQNSNFKIAGKELNDFTQLLKDWLFTKYQRFGIGQGSKIYYFNCSK
jgi:tRNA (guanine-N7-)-methyltransferase